MTFTHSLKGVWSLFIGYLLLFVLNFLIPSDNPGPGSRMWLLLSLCTVIISVLLLIKHKLPTKRQILFSVLFAAAVFVAYINLSVFNMIETSILTLLASLAVFSTFNRFSEGKLLFLNSKNRRSVAVSLLTGVTAGVLLGYVNLLIGGNASGDFSPRLQYFTVALSPAIFEELAFRTLFYALCLTLLNGRIETKAQRLTVMFMMIMPHVLIHTPDIFINGGVMSGVVSTTVLALLFGLPFALLQQKRDIASAMLAHGIVDVIRFCFAGLPI
ncbi:type II CAAX prenyl endopeptidase Rce1 family protein [Paenibacillus tepidiphilus]|uniref:CPBP family glutamic-type intramembrane protease n=1 Tax=Paenibacillus tepidiphilus TaxID=2608683 RepID=UPI00123B9EA8|nr:CPBP family glutamic-type intramembrane protease [Paenibacillus tepidiphilus]